MKGFHIWYFTCGHLTSLLGAEESTFLWSQCPASTNNPLSWLTAHLPVLPLSRVFAVTVASCCLSPRLALSQRPHFRHHCVTLSLP